MLRISQRVLGALLVAGTLAAASPAPAQIAEFPSKPIRIVVGFAAGGAPDALARIVAEKLSQRWRQGVVVENRVGARATRRWPPSPRPSPTDTRSH